MTDRLLDVGTVARRLDVTPVTIRNWIRSGKLRAERTLTGRYRIRASILASLLQKSERSESPADSST